MAPQASSFPLRHLTVALACAGLALALAGCASAPPQASAAHQPQGQPGYSAQAAQATQPALAQYSLVHAAHLPHLAWALKGQTTALALNEVQRGTLAALAFEVRDQLQPRLEQARATEQDIAQAALAGASVPQLAAQLDRLQQLKREAAQVQIDATQRIRTTLDAAQYQQLRQRAHAQAPAAPAMPEYSLLLPAHLPHLMPFVAKLNASAEHQQALSRYADEQVRPALRPRLQQAQQLEQEIAPHSMAAARKTWRPSSTAWPRCAARPQKSTCAASPRCARPCRPSSTRACWRWPSPQRAEARATQHPPFPIHDFTEFFA